MKRSELRALIRECIRESTNQQKLDDNDWLTFLSSQWTYKLKLSDVKLIRYKKSGKKLVLGDIDGELGHMHVVVTDKNLERTVFGGKERLTMDAFLKWLIKHGASESKVKSGGSKTPKYNKFSQYD